MANRNFPSRVPHVQPGSPVSASNTSASTRSLESRTNYLKEIVDAIEAGRLLVRRNQPLAPEVLEGSAVYWDDQNKRFDVALAAVQNDPTSGAFLMTTSSDCLGICVVKDNPTGGTIALLGMACVTSEILGNMIDGTPTPGRYYLSGSNPGKLVLQQPPVTVGVAYLLGPADNCETSSWLLINPQIRDFLEDHIHYQFHLVPEPAGQVTPPVPGEHHSIFDPDPDKKGWLPADHESFNGAAPRGAKFGYNLKADIALNRVWPPIPAAAALLEWFQPLLDGQPQAFLGLERVQEGYVLINMYGIWWMTDCYNQVPWPTHLDTTQSLSSSMSMSEVSMSSESVSEVCPDAPPMELILSFLKMTFATDKTCVTSLQPDKGQPIEFVNCNGVVANTGDLYARLLIQALLDPILIRGGIVFKNVKDAALTFQRGWVAEALIAGSDEIILNGSHQELLDPTQPAGVNNPMIHQGLVTVDVQLDPSDRELAPQVVQLEDALEREYENVIYIGFPQGRDSAIRMRFNVPPTGLPNNPTLSIRTLVFGRAVGPFSAMTMSYYRIPRPVAGTPVPIGEGDTSIGYDLVTPTSDYDGHGTDLPANNIIEVTSDSFDISPGDTVFVMLARAASAGPLYQADIGVIRVGGIIASGD